MSYEPLSTVCKLESQWAVAKNFTVKPENGEKNERIYIRKNKTQTEDQSLSVGDHNNLDGGCSFVAFMEYRANKK
jgi:hypothetical protein